MNKTLLFLAVLGFIFNSTAQNTPSYACNTCTMDSLALYENGYHIGPWNVNCDEGVHTESKWVDTKGMDSILFKTFQHRTYDNSAIYDEAGNLIYEWGGISESAT